MNSIEIISKVSSKNLSQEETAHIMQEIFLGKISEQEIENFLLSLSEKGETSDELTGAVMAMRAASLKVDLKKSLKGVDLMAVIPSNTSMTIFNDFIIKYPIKICI